MKMKKRILLLFSLVLLGGTGAAGQSVVRVACIGDSITAGSGASDRQSRSYPAVLAALLGERYEVKNFGIGGRTLLKNGDRPYWVEDFFGESQAWRPDIVVVKLGTNDSKPQNWDTHGAEFEADLRQMLTTYRDLPNRPKVYVCFPARIADNRMGIRESVVAAEIIPIISRVAAETGVSVIDLHTTLYQAPHLLPDGVHPNDLGYVLLARDVYERIK
jgi:lysophospholipase L1-like esterase